MIRFILSVLLFSSSFAFAQQDTTTVFQRPKGYFTDPVRSKWKKKVTEKNGHWIVGLYNRKNVLQEEIGFSDSTLTVRKGPYSLYENGNLKVTGKYDKGYKVDEWSYYDEHKHLSEQMNYTWDKLNGRYRSYWDNGKLKSEGRYVGNKKTGVWKTFDENGKIIANESL
ncbi:MAG: hypothetical protein V4541_04995 [Bacteroidota bacterium]